MLLRVLAIVLLATGIVAAQGKFGAAPAASTTGKTVLEEFTDKLKLDDKVQIPAAERVFTAAARAAIPVTQEMVLQRRHMLDAELANKTDDAKLALEAYTEASRKMASIEASAFARVFSDLKPNQKSKVPEAFALLTGFFQTVAAPAGPPRRGGGGDR